MRSIKVILPGSIRSKKNSKAPGLIRSRTRAPRPGIFSSKAYVQWERSARLGIDFCNPSKDQICIRNIGKGKSNFYVPALKQLMTGPICIKAMIYYSGPKPDVDGSYASIADCLQGIIYENDGMIEHWDGSRRIHCKENPRTEVEIMEFKE